MDIWIDQLSFTYPAGVTALQEVSLKISSGESVAIIGENGAGKTTLVKHINGLLKPTSGQVLVGGWNTREYTVAQLASKVGYVFQNPDDQLFASTVWAEVLFGPKNIGLTMEQATERADAALRAVGLIDSAQKHPYDLSISQRKKVAVASVLAMQTPMLVLDEPTTGQDHNDTELVGQIVEDLKEQGRTVITITHDIDFCAEHFDRVVVMAQGMILLDGPARDTLIQTEILAQTHVEPPQLMRLSEQLNMQERPLNVEEFIEFWCP
ncbi:MAG TPA: ABC transporter ATP-binding protein, partial [Anaerolineales bacterium]